MPLQQELDLHQRIDVLETAQSRLEQQFRQLRGYVYAKKGLVGPAQTAPEGDYDLPAAPATPTADAAPAGSKDELRRRLVATGRFIPGQKPNHSE